jgi:hypothetical protein
VTVPRCAVRVLVRTARADPPARIAAIAMPSSVIGARRRRRRERAAGGGRRSLVGGTPLVAKEDRAMLAVAVLHATAEGDQILVGVNHGPLARSGCAGVVGAFIQSHPAAAKLVSSTYLWPRQSTAHTVFPRIAPRPPRLGPFWSRCGDSPRLDPRITGSHRAVKKGVWPSDDTLIVCSAGLSAPSGRASAGLRAC